jgi:beta-lactamase class A
VKIGRPTRLARVAWPARVARLVRVTWPIRLGRPGRAALVIGTSLAVAIGLLLAVLTSGGKSGGPATAASAPAGRTPAPAALASAAARPAQARPRPHPDPFAAAVTPYLAGRAGVVSAAVDDLRTGRVWTIGPARPQAEASIVKVDILETLLAHSGGGLLSSADQELAQNMIEDSDNSSATDLWQAVGGAGGIASFNAAAGLAHTSPSACVQCAGFPWPGWGLTTTTPTDQIALLRELAGPGPLLTGTERRYVVSLMESVIPSQRWGVSGGVPPQATVALKNGWLPLDQAATDWQVNSVGWVVGLGRDYLMAVLTTGNPSEQYGIDTIDALSTAIWQNLGETVAN